MNAQTHHPAHGHDHDDAHGHPEHEHDHDHEEFDYVAAILDGRAAKDRFFATSPTSPIPSVRARAHANDRDKGGHDHGAHDHGAHEHDGHADSVPADPPFGGLSYFEPDPAYQFEIERPLPYEGSDPVEFEMTTSDGRVRTAFRVATLPFDFDGQALRLHAYRFAGSPEGSLFVPFQDATSGTETYGAARYLDLEVEDDGVVILDFNLAYHPYCAYNESYSCPLPPAENRLPVRIEAGERLPL